MGGERKAYPLRVDPALWAAVERGAAADLRSGQCPGRMPAARSAEGAGVKLDAPAGQPRPAAEGADRSAVGDHAAEAATDSHSRTETAAISRPKVGGFASHSLDPPCQMKRNAMALASASAISSSFQRKSANGPASRRRRRTSSHRSGPSAATRQSRSVSARRTQRRRRDPAEQAGQAQVEDADSSDQHHQPEQVNEVRDRIDVAAGPDAERRRLDGLAESAQPDPLVSAARPSCRPR